MRAIIGTILLVCITASQPTLAQTALDHYVQKPDPNYSWEIYASDKDLLVETFYVKLSSQQWRNANEVDRPLWQHELIITAPKFKLCRTNNSPQTALLFISGGKNPASGVFGTSNNEAFEYAALSLCSVVAVLKQVPNQPLNFSDDFNRPRTEDAILAYSFDKFLATGDPEWPVHLAMTKAVVRAMDTITEVSKQEVDDVTVEDFIVFGGSKRGWTTWLTAAVDPRVKAIMPISIDMLNLSEQFKHHWETYGFYTPSVYDYLEYDIVCRPQSSAIQQLLDIVDPYSYRDRYTMPKLIINSAGDQFFVSDSSQFYYDQLPEPKYLRYTANTDHAQGDDEEDLIELFLTVRSWIDDVNDNKASPHFDWSFEPDGSIRVQTSEQAKRVRLLQAHNPNARDFRLETIGEAWTGSDLEDSGSGVYHGFVAEPGQGFSAFFIEVEFEEGAVLEANQIFTTGVRVTPDILPFAGTACLSPANYTNLWWNPRQPGQAVQIVQQQNEIGLAWYVHDEFGQPVWTTLLGSLTVSNSAEASTTGALLQFSGPPLGTLWNNQQVSNTAAGNATIDFHSTTYATFQYTLNGIPGKMALVPFERLADTDYTGVWYDPLQAGQGVQLIRNGDALSGAWYHFNHEGKDSWVTFAGVISNQRLEANLLRFHGPLLSHPWQRDALQSSIVGTVQIELVSTTTLIMDYTLDGHSGRLELQPFELP